MLEEYEGCTSLGSQPVGERGQEYFMIGTLTTPDLHQTSTLAIFAFS